MNNYEVMYIIRPTIEDELRQQLVERYSALVAENGGNVEKIDDWGRRKFSYEIDDLTEGHYILMYFQSSPEFPRELERQFRINEDIMRYMVIRKDEEKKSEAAAQPAAEPVAEPVAEPAQPQEQA